MLVLNLNAPAIFSFLKTSPDIFRHFWMCETPQLAFQHLEGGRGKLLEPPLG
jgi:hypothetical protein